MGEIGSSATSGKIYKTEKIESFFLKMRYFTIGKNVWEKRKLKLKNKRILIVEQKQTELKKQNKER